MILQPAAEHSFHMPHSTTTPSYAQDLQKVILAKSPPKHHPDASHFIPASPPTSWTPSSSPVLLSPFLHARKTIGENRRIPSPGSPKWNGSLKKDQLSPPSVSAPPADAANLFPTNARVIRNKKGDIVRPCIRPVRAHSASSIRPSTSPISAAQLLLVPQRPELRKSLTFDGKIERVVLFSRGSQPDAISNSEKYEVQDSGDFEVANVSAALELAEQWVIVRKNLQSAPSSGSGQIPVVLDSINISPDGKFLIGTIHVRNWGFEKVVNVRYTWNDWASEDDIDNVDARFAGVLSAGFGDFAGVDKFDFELDLNGMFDGKGADEECRVQFAIKYVVNGREYWDNNGSHNYEVVVKHPYPAAQNRPVPKIAGPVSPKLAWQVPSRSTAIPIPSAAAKHRNARPPPSTPPVLPIHISSLTISDRTKPGTNSGNQTPSPRSSPKSRPDPFERYALGAGSPYSPAIEPIPVPQRNSPSEVNSYGYNLGYRSFAARGLLGGRDGGNGRDDGLYANEDTFLAWSPPSGGFACRA